jgi:hypothetical protein
MTDGRTQPTVSIIIPDTDAPMIGDLLRRLWPQVTALPDGGTAEVIVVGTDAPDGVAAQGLARFIETPAGTGAADKRNLGMRLARGELFAFLDDDCLPATDWLAQHLRRHARGEQVVGGAVTFGAAHYCQLADNVSAFHDLLPWTSAGARPWLATANLSVRRGVVERCGMMVSPDRRAEDLEWTARFRRHGYRLYFEPAAVVWHDPSRRTLAAVWRHWVDDAPGTLRVRLRHADLLGTPRLAGRRWPYAWGSPLVALWATARTFAHPRTLQRYGHTLPLVYLTKLAWCWSAYRAFARASAGEPATLPPRLADHAVDYADNVRAGEWT